MRATQSEYDIYELRFWHWYDYENGDGGIVHIGKYDDDYKIYEWIPISSCFSGSSIVWSPYHIDITQFAGEKISIAFHHINDDDQYVGYGWYIDDIRIVPNDIIDKATPPTPYKTQYTFSAPTSVDNNLILQPPTGFQLGNVSFDVLSIENEDLEYTDGAGIRVNINKNEGATFFGKPFEVKENDIVYVRVSTQTSDSNVALAVGALDAVMADSIENAALDGSIGVNMIINSEQYVDQFGYLWACYEPKRNAVVPVFQVANSNEENTVTVQFDNLEIYRFSKNQFPEPIRSTTSTLGNTINGFFQMGNDIYGYGDKIFINVNQ